MKTRKNKLITMRTLNKTKTSTQAEAAKAIRIDLKKAFPQVRFRVKSKGYAGGESVYIEWENGPTYDSVNKLTAKYQYSEFDPMTDSYDYTNPQNDMPQVKYVLITRQISEQTLNEVFKIFQPHYYGWEILKGLDESSQGFFKQWGHWTPREFIRRQLSKVDLTHGYQIS